MRQIAFSTGLLSMGLAACWRKAIELADEFECLLDDRAGIDAPDSPSKMQRLGLEVRGCTPQTIKRRSSSERRKRCLKKYRVIGREPDGFKRYDNRLVSWPHPSP